MINIEDDLILLGMKIKKDPLTFRMEFLKKLQYLQSLLQLENPPEGEVRPYGSFILQHVWRYKDSGEEFTNITVTIEQLVKKLSKKAVKPILNELILCRQKQLINSATLFSFFLQQESNCDRLESFADSSILPTLENFLKGTEKQQRISYFYLLILCSKKVEVSHLLSFPFITNCSIKLKKLCYLYFLNNLDVKFTKEFLKRETVEEIGNILVREIKEEKNREEKGIKLRIFIGMNYDRKKVCWAIKEMLKLVDEDSRETRELLTVVAENLKVLKLGEKKEIVEFIRERMLSEFNTDEVISQGMNILREIISVKKVDVEEDVDTLGKDTYDTLVDKDTYDTDKYDTLIGNILDKEVDNTSICNTLVDTNKLNTSICNTSIGNNINTPTDTVGDDCGLGNIKKLVLNAVAPFKDSKVKCVLYAYRSVINAVKGKFYVTDFFLRKKAEKSEKELKRKEGQKKAKANRSKNRNKKKNKLFQTKKKN